MAVIDYQADIDAQFEDADDATWKKEDPDEDVSFKAFVNHVRTDPEEHGVRYPGFRIEIVCPSQSISDMAKGAIIEIGLQEYEVKLRLDDGLGVSTLIAIENEAE